MVVLSTQICVETSRGLSSVKALQAWDVLADVVGVSGASCRPFAAWPRCLPLIMPVDPRRDLIDGPQL